MQSTAGLIGEAELGYKKKGYGTHSIRSGAAMALTLSGYPAFRVMFVGRLPLRPCGASRCLRSTKVALRPEQDSNFHEPPIKKPRRMAGLFNGAPGKIRTPDP